MSLQDEIKVLTRKALVAYLGALTTFAVDALLSSEKVTKESKTNILEGLKLANQLIAEGKHEKARNILTAIEKELA